MAGQGGAHDACGSSRCSALLSHSDHAQPHSCRAHEAHWTLPTKPLVSAAQLLSYLLIMQPIQPHPQQARPTSAVCLAISCSVAASK